jgi:hypothetical protein
MSPRPRRLRWGWLAGLACIGGVDAQSVAWHGYLDLRVASGPDERAWSDGGLGKTRFGRGDATDVEGVLSGAFQLAPEWLAVSELQYRPGREHPLDLLDAWIRYRPVSTTPWRWSVKAGAFFPPVSLENDAVGWTSPWTLTPSAGSSWIGEEVRTLGAELRVEHRAPAGTASVVAALYRGNDPAGELLASRGWALGDLTSPLHGDLRQPDVYAPLARAEVPVEYRPFVEIDDRIGWYAGMDYATAGGNTFNVLRYDNRADPTRYQLYDERKVFAWRTRYWSMGAQARVGDVVLIAQAMDGSTAFEPRAGLLLDTRFHAGSLLAAWDRGRWRPALRLDLFSLRQLPDTLADPLDEHGNAMTLALNWRPREFLRVTGELLRVDSRRDQRRLEGSSPRQVEVQSQLSLRLEF